MVQNTQTMKVGSLFAGIGGFDLGLERAGMEIVWQVEIDSYCNKVLTKHWPNVRRYGDIRKVGSHNLERVDLICGGFPCQPFSVAGKRTGKKDNRYLWPEMFRVIKELRPAWVLGENVAGIISMVLDDVLFELEGEGYETSTFIIPACAVNAPHRRNRVWIVARNTDSMRCDRNGGTQRGFQNKNPIGNGIRQDVANSEQSRRRGRISERVSDCEWRTTREKSESLQSRHRETYPSDLESGSQDVADSPKQRLEGERKTTWSKSNGFGQSCWWESEPDVGRVAHGVPNRVDRLKCLGNAVVPQIVEIIGRAIIETSYGK